MKRKLAFGFSILLIALIIAVLPISGEEKIYDDVIRLHILAESDSEEDQAVKLLVRDAVIEEYGTALSRYPDQESAADAARALIPAITATAEETLHAAGHHVPVQVTLTEEEYPRRDYGTFSLPAGSYLSMRILLGDAEGQNWWCVMYPPLCLDTALDGDAHLSDAEWGLLHTSRKGKYTPRFKLLEFLENIFS